MGGDRNIVNIKEDLLNQATKIAKDDGRTLEGLIEHLINKEVKRIANKKKRESIARDPVQDILLPPFIDRELFKEYIDFRVSKLIPVTRRVQDRLINTLVTFHEQGMNTSDILIKSTNSGWKDLYAIKGVSNAGCRAISKTSISDDLQFNDF